LKLVGLAILSLSRESHAFDKDGNDNIKFLAIVIGEG
jgi:hypothetical protein